MRNCENLRRGGKVKSALIKVQNLEKTCSYDRSFKGNIGRRGCQETKIGAGERGPKVRSYFVFKKDV